MRALERSFLVLWLITSVMCDPTASDYERNLPVITTAANAFGARLFQKIAEGQQENLICSPLSANIALSMAATGALGNTKTQFTNVLNLPPQAQALRGYQYLINTMNDVENVTLKVANKMFINRSFEVKPDYKRDLQTYFRSDIDSVDFSKSEEAASTINNWAKERTNNRIDGVIQPGDVDASTALVLANAVYFKGNWANQFDHKNTEDRPFHINENTVKNVPTMYRTGYYKYVELPNHDVKCLELPYANEELRMMIILPNEINGLAKLTENMDEVFNTCLTLINSAYSREVRLYLPKFKTESKLDLGDTLANKMGLSEPFSNRANFRRMSESPLQISKVVQKAFIEVNEEGSEAAAVTGGLIVPASLIIPREMKIDHPFFYNIIKTMQHDRNDGAIVQLFAGVITDF